jgi:predicted P-loop ATPase
MAGGREAAAPMTRPPYIRHIPDSEDPPTPWMSDCIWKYSDKHPPRLDRCINNAIVILGRSPEWKGKIKLDTFANQITITDPPWPTEYSNPNRRPTERISDVDIDCIRAWLISNHRLALSATDVNGAIQTVARGNAESSARTWMESIVWDGKPRLDNWLTTYIGVHYDPYSRMVGKWCLVSAVARVFKPGAKVDNVLIIEGEQRAGKSTALRTLAGDAWFSDTPIDIGSKDAYSRLPGKLIVELAEIDTVRRADVSSAKAFFSSSVDHYRPAYGRFEIESQRQSIFVGTVNPTNTYLSDPSGNTRFWPVTCGAIDNAALKEDREQLWAETAHEYQAGAKFYPATRAEHEICAEHQDKRAPGRDDWCDLIEPWLARVKLLASDDSGDENGFTPRVDPDAITIMDIAKGAIDLKDNHKIGMREKLRISACMIALGGYESYRIKSRTSPHCNKLCYRPLPLEPGSDD